MGVAEEEEKKLRKQDTIAKGKISATCRIRFFFFFEFF